MRRAYRMAMVWQRPSFTFSKIFSSENAWPIKAKLHVGHPKEGGTKVYSSSLEPVDRLGM